MLLDTNTIVRYVTNQPKSQALSVKKMVHAASAGHCELTLLPMVVAECVFVLSSYYKLDRTEVCKSLSVIVRSPEIMVKEGDSILKALHYFGSKKLDFVDCYLAARSVINAEEVLSFDKDFGKMEGVNWVNPTNYK
jgi:predicted nucleic-acid-binding protein